MQLNTLTNEQLVRRYKETGNEIYFNQLYKKNQRMIYSLSSKYCSLNVNYNVEDIRSLALMGFFKAVKAFDSSKANKFSTLAVIAMRNEIYRINVDLNRQKRKCSYEVTSLYSIPPNCECDLNEIVQYEENVFDGVNSILDNDTYDMLVCKIKEVLTDRQFKIVELLLEGFEQKEIAKQFGVSPQSINLVMKTIRKKIKQNNIL